MKRTLFIIFACIIAIPFLLLAGYLACKLVVNSYAVYLLKQAVPDAEYMDYQCYEYADGPVHSYDVHFYQFTEYNPDYTKDWESDSTDENMCKVRRIHSSLFPDVIIITPSAHRATIEFHLKY